MKERSRIRRLVLAAFFVAIEVVLVLTPIGMVPIGPIRATTMHIPVILGGILLGPGFGSGVGFVFGLLSLLKNTFEPTVTSFVFSPFITIGGMQGNLWSLVIVLVPRILIGFLSGIAAQWCKKQKHTTMIYALLAGVCTLIHTILVMGGIWIFFGAPYAAAQNLSLEAASALILTIITTNGVIEAIVAAIIVPVLVKALQPVIERMGVEHDR